MTFLAGRSSTPRGAKTSADHAIDPSFSGPTDVAAAGGTRPTFLRLADSVLGLNAPQERGGLILNEEFEKSRRRSFWLNFGALASQPVLTAEDEYSIGPQNPNTPSRIFIGNSATFAEFGRESIRHALREFVVGRRNSGSLLDDLSFSIFKQLERGRVVRPVSFLWIGRWREASSDTAKAKAAKLEIDRIGLREVGRSEALSRSAFQFGYLGSGNSSKLTLVEMDRRRELSGLGTSVVRPHRDIVLFRINRANDLDFVRAEGRSPSGYAFAGMPSESKILIIFGQIARKAGVAEIVREASLLDRASNYKVYDYSIPLLPGEPAVLELATSEPDGLELADHLELIPSLSRLFVKTGFLTPGNSTSNVGGMRPPVSTLGHLAAPFGSRAIEERGFGFLDPRFDVCDQCGMSSGNSTEITGGATPRASTSTTPAELDFRGPFIERERIVHAREEVTALDNSGKTSESASVGDAVGQAVRSDAVTAPDNLPRRILHGSEISSAADSLPTLAAVLEGLRTSHILLTTDLRRTPTLEATARHAGVPILQAMAVLALPGFIIRPDAVFDQAQGGDRFLTDLIAFAHRTSELRTDAAIPALEIPRSEEILHSLSLVELSTDTDARRVEIRPNPVAGSNATKSLPAKLALFEESRQKLQEPLRPLFCRFVDEINRLPEEARTMGSVEANKRFTSELQSLASALGKRFTCPKCAEPGSLMCVAGTSPGGVWKFSHSANGVKTTHGGSSRLPKLKFVKAND